MMQSKYATKCCFRQQLPRYTEYVPYGVIQQRDNVTTTEGALSLSGLPPPHLLVQYILLLFPPTLTMPADARPLPEIA